MGNSNSKDDFYSWLIFGRDHLPDDLLNFGNFHDGLVPFKPTSRTELFFVQLNSLEKDEEYVSIMHTQVTLILRKLEFEGRNLDYTIPEGWCNNLMESQ